MILQFDLDSVILVDNNLSETPLLRYCLVLSTRWHSWFFVCTPNYVNTMLSAPLKGFSLGEKGSVTQSCTVWMPGIYTSYVFSR